MGFRAHFLAKYVAPDGSEVILDPFAEGAVLTREDCQQKLNRMTGGTATFRDEYLAPTPEKLILWRMLNNLKDIYVKGHVIDKCLLIVDMMLMVDSEDLTQFRDRGLLRMQLRQFDGAGRDLEYYLQHAQNAQDREEIENHVKELKRIRAMMN